MLGRMPQTLTPQFTATAAPRRSGVGLDPEPCATHIRDVLTQVPWASPGDFARAAGVNAGTVRGLIADTEPRSVRQATQERILSTGPQDIAIRPNLVGPADAARQTVRSLMADGWTLREVFECAGLHVDPWWWTHPEAGITFASHRAIQAADSTLRAGTGGTAKVPRVRVVRRAEALMTQGWARADLADRAGVVRSVLQEVKGSSMSSVEVFRAVDGAFQQLRLKDGGKERVRTLARRYGYAPWAAWRDGAMDDPAGVPDFEFVDDPEWAAAIRRRFASAA